MLKIDKIHDLRSQCEIVNGEVYEVFHLTMEKREEKLSNTRENSCKGRRHRAEEWTYDDQHSNPGAHDHLAFVPLVTLARQCGRTFQLLFCL